MKMEYVMLAIIMKSKKNNQSIKIPDVKRNFKIFTIC